MGGSSSSDVRAHQDVETASCANSFTPYHHNWAHLIDALMFSLFFGVEPISAFTAFEHAVL